ncbi:fructosamine kinase family protein [Amycolatopsis alkalitolerans]|uniref:Fructosamine kinase n=1 Tax=Amycolatopsis alkalitolerans TaxID=2547244 RepID=A0A5C4LXB2_9PSEU|nr:fructosamine kinase family protein [Amycolatopsis alkalitolerans]TNC23150.1 fructosamine kinase [Amycolatopsis alkalitolerans]
MNARDAVERLYGRQVTGVRHWGGSIFLVSSGNETVVAKQGVGPGATTAEAAGLRWLGESGDVSVPRVHAHDDEWLIMQYVPPTSPTAEAAETFGRNLARLHLRGAEGFGSPPPGGPVDAWMGVAPMRNETCPDWPSFYAQHRILPYLRECADQKLFSADEVEVFEKLCGRLKEVAEPEPPARLHGDAWSGNVHWARDGVWLIDPAAHGGHREGDLAMLQLFGTSQLSHILGGYAEGAQDEGAPLAAGWQDRVPVHQLFPLLMHAAVFGGGYARQALMAARAAPR